MIKLYKHEAGRIARYHEVWVSGDSITEHWGERGTRGDTATHAVDPALAEEANLERILAGARRDGFAELAEDDFEVLIVIEHQIDGMGTRDDLTKRHALQQRMDETLDWTGLGHCDWGSTGSGTMEVCCVVVDFELAERVIHDDLRETPFGDFRRIYGGEDA